MEQDFEKDKLQTVRPLNYKIFDIEKHFRQIYKISIDLDIISTNPQ